MRRTIAWTLAGMFATGLSVAVVAGVKGAAASPRAARREHVLRVDSKLPGWLAPGAAATVGGFAGSFEHLRLLTSGGVVVARTRSGRLGHFLFRFHAERSGRYQLRVAAGHVTIPAGVLIVRPLVLEAVGDVTFGEQVAPAIAAYGAAYPWRGVATLLRTADITVGNLETAVTNRGDPVAKDFTFRGPPQALRPMAHLAGFDALTLANNHSGDFGRDATIDTIRSVRAIGIQPFGAGANIRLAHRPALVRAGGLKVALLGYSDINPSGFNATATSAGTAKADPALIAADVRAARRRGDLVVCFLHWGVELRPQPDARQQQLASACVNAGATLVVGAHPHVLGPISRPRPRTVVAWTLGNFVFPSAGVTARTAILQVQLAADGVRSFRLLPVQINGFRPKPLKDG